MIYLSSSNISIGCLQSDTEYGVNPGQVWLSFEWKKLVTIFHQAFWILKYVEGTDTDV